MNKLLMPILMCLIFSCEPRSESTNEEANLNIVEFFKSSPKIKELVKLISWDDIYFRMQSKKELDGLEFKNAFDKLKEDFVSNSFYLDSSGKDILFRQTSSYLDKNNLHVVFEIFNGGDFQFIDFELDTISNKVDEMFVYGVGETLSSIIEKQLNLGQIKDLNEYREVFFLSSAALEKGEIQESWDYLNIVPEDKLKEFPFRGLKMKIAESDPLLYSDLVNEVKLLPVDKRYLNYLRFKSGILNDNPNDIIENCEKLRLQLGESIVLSLFESYAYWIDGNIEMASIKCDEAIKTEPEYVQSYINKIDILLSNNEVNKALQLIDTVNSKFKITDEEWKDILIDFSDIYKDLFPV